MRRALLAASFLAAAAGTATNASAWDVESGSSANRVALELYNLERETPLAGIAVEIVAAPDWVRSAEVPAPPAGAVYPGEKTDVMLRFDVAPDVLPGATGGIEIAVTSADGDLWRETIPLAVVDQAQALQTDCCSAVEIGTATGVTEDAGALGPDHQLVITSFPNPSRPSVTIRFTLPVASTVQVSVHDVTGRLVRTILSERREAGALELRWDGRDENGQPAGSGLYFVRVQAGDDVHTAKVVLAR